MREADHLSPAYVGRFAPSPTGPLHFGSLVAALGSYLEARRHGGRWALRIEDVDRFRTVAGAADRILRTLEAHGLGWDGVVIRQSDRDDAYRVTLERLIDSGLAYPCGCSRREIQAEARRGPAGAVYPGTCRHGLPPGRRARSWRLRIDANPIRFHDRLRGDQSVDLARDIGDFLIRRGDGLFAYHLAMVVDDAELGVTDVVRGGDLLDCVAPQIALQHALDLPAPGYLHLPVAVNAAGRKLSKQTDAPPLDDHRAGENLYTALAFLNQSAPRNIAGADAAEVLAWARDHWDPQRLPRLATITVDD